jgi:citrate lyase subunit beta/citryl-CoA lyase
MGAKLCLHPAQVPSVNVAFDVPAELVAWARMVAAAGRKSGGGVVSVDGEMLDRPQFELAARILRQATDPRDHGTP